jgi:hypothetical protein
MSKSLIPEGRVAGRTVQVYCFKMTGRRFGLGAYVYFHRERAPHFYPLPLEASFACALFPGMVAAGRVYADLVVSEIER